ncbi:hypothetical protein B0H15DRAFT_1006522, partial [Mycena belliarum]
MTNGDSDLPGPSLPYPTRAITPAASSQSTHPPCACTSKPFCSSSALPPPNYPRAAPEQPRQPSRAAPCWPPSSTTLPPPRTRNRTPTLVPRPSPTSTARPTASSSPRPRARGSTTLGSTFRAVGLSSSQDPTHHPSTAALPAAWDGPRHARAPTTCAPRAPRLLRRVSVPSHSHSHSYSFSPSSYPPPPTPFLFPYPSPRPSLYSTSTQLNP